MTTSVPATATGGESIPAPENVQPTGPGKKPEPSPVLPDGKGLKLAQVRELLHTVHNQSVPPDDPLLMVVTICNAFLGEIEALHQRHEAGLSRLMADKSGAYVAAITKAVDKLSAGLSSASAEGMKLAASGLEKRLASFRNSLAWLAAIVCVSALANIIAFVLLAVR